MILKRYRFFSGDDGGKRWNSGRILGCDQKLECSIDKEEEEEEERDDLFRCQFLRAAQSERREWTVMIFFLVV